jgi:hypothetical protein
MKRGRGRVEPSARERRGRTQRMTKRKTREIEDRETRRKSRGGRPTRSLSRRGVPIRVPDRTRTRSVSRRDRPRIRYRKWTDRTGRR